MAVSQDDCTTRCRLAGMVLRLFRFSAIDCISVPNSSWSISSVPLCDWPHNECWL